MWGDPKIRGKSAINDLLEKKKSYPVVLGFELSERFTWRWQSGPVKQEDIADILNILEIDGIKKMVEEENARKIAWRLTICILYKAQMVFFPCWMN